LPTYKHPRDISIEYCNEYGLEEGLLLVPTSTGVEQSHYHPQWSKVNETKNTKEGNDRDPRFRGRSLFAFTVYSRDEVKAVKMVALIVMRSVFSLW